MGRIKIIPSADKTTPDITVSSIIMVKQRFALSFSPSPRYFAVSALPPVPIIKPTPPRIIRKGITRFTAAKGSFPTKFEIKKPSTTP